jgi:hypothetical protein
VISLRGLPSGEDAPKHYAQPSCRSQPPVMGEAYRSGKDAPVECAPVDPVTARKLARTGGTSSLGPSPTV